jgi:hypothetical protein
LSSINPKVLPYLQLYLDKYGTSMLTSLVIVSRQPDRSAPCSRLSASSPVTISPVVHPVSVQQLTKCSSRKSFVLKTIHFDGGGCAPSFPCSPSHDHDPFVRISYLLFPFFSNICALFCAILHFLARIKYATLFFSSDSALFGKNTRSGVPPSLTEEQNEAIPGNLRSITRPFNPSCLRRRSRLSLRC